MVVRRSASRSSGARSMDGRAPLLLAMVRAGNGSEVRELLASGVDADSRDELSHDGATALYVAVCLNCIEIVSLLLHYGADVNSPTSWGNRPLHAAADLGNEVIVTLLLQHKDSRGRPTEVNARNRNGDTALHLAAARGHFRVCRRLLHHLADPCALNNRHRTAVDEASANGKTAVIMELGRHLPANGQNEFSNSLTALNGMTSSISPRLWYCRRQDPVESEDTSGETSEQTTSSDEGLLSPSGDNNRSTPASSSECSSPAYSMGSSFSSDGSSSPSSLSFVGDVLRDSQSGAVPLRMYQRKQAYRRANSWHPQNGCDSEFYEQERTLSGQVPHYHGSDPDVKLLNGPSGRDHLPESEPILRSPLYTFLDRTRMQHGDHQLKVEIDKNEALQKRLVIMEEENARLRSLVNGKT